MFTATSFKEVGPRTNVHIPKEVLQELPCGVFRATYDETASLIPELAPILETFPMEAKEDYEFDVKIHMLMPDQFPCIPNWHCDNVRRDANGFLSYERTLEEPGKPMFIWLSGTPCTEFLVRPLVLSEVPKSHVDLGNTIETLMRYASPDSPTTTFIPAQQWVEFTNTSPHRGVKSESFQWRIFIRATHKSTLPVRSQINPLRRHCQVYLDAATFGW